MTYLRFLLLFYALSTIFVSGGLFFKRAGLSYSLLSAFGLLFGLEMLDFLYSTSELIYIHPELYGYYHMPIGFLYGPVLWFHFLFFIKPDFKFKWAHLVHLLPFLIVVITFSDILAMPGSERMQYMWVHFLERIMPYNYTRSAHILSYGVGIVYLVYRHFSSLAGNKRIYAIAICTIYFLTAVLLSWLVGYADGWRQFIYYYLLASTMVFLIGYALYKDPRFLTQIARKYLHSALAKGDMERIAEKVSLSLNQEKLFLRKDLTLRKLSDEIEEKPHKISQTLSELMKESFSDLINRCRVNHAKEMLLDPTFNHYKIEAIALESGFNNKVTFHKAFQKFESMTPATYRSEHT
ncbi:MAG: hypothetical protein Roseis2KO_10770 [Roseivirga sp.]